MTPRQLVRNVSHLANGRTAVRPLVAGAMLAAAATLGAPRPLQASQPLETETAYLMKGGRLKVESTFEYQTSADGTETALPMAFEYGILGNLELAVEPVWYTAIRPKLGRKATGLGDTEATLSWRFIEENGLLPAIATAAEVKFPTARDNLIGTGQFDYALYLIASKKYGDFKTHFNVGYTLVGQPAGAHLNNTWSFALAEEWKVVKNFDLVGEGLLTTASVSSAAAGTESAQTPEVGGLEAVGTLGARFYFLDNFFASLGVSYDNNDALLIRPGLTAWVN